MSSDGTPTIHAVNASTAGYPTSSGSSYETDCGVELGYISSALLPEGKHGLGLSVAFTDNTDEDDGSRAGFEWSISPGYYYFFSGIGERGLNLGIGSRIVLGARGFGTNPLMLNLGFQF